MTVSFTYERTKQIAKNLLTLGFINYIWLQARQVISDEKYSIQITGNNDFEEISFDDTKGITAYFRDIGATITEDAGTDACSVEKWAIQKVRLVVTAEKSATNGGKLVKEILRKLAAQDIAEIYFNEIDILQQELPDSKLSLSVDSLLFAVDFEVRELIQLQDCVQDIDCAIENLRICGV